MVRKEKEDVWEESCVVGHLVCRNMLGRNMDQSWGAGKVSLGRGVGRELMQLIIKWVEEKALLDLQHLLLAPPFPTLCR